MFKVAQVITGLCLMAGYSLKLNDSSMAPDCVGTVLESSPESDWRCSGLGGKVGEEKKCTERYEAGSGGQVHRQCTVHKASASLFNCLASTPCKVKEEFRNTCSCPNGVAVSGLDCQKHNSITCASCNSGYDLLEKSCKFRTCTCKHGEASTGASCPAAGEEDCTKCTVTSFELVKEDGKNVCKSPFGEMMGQLAEKAAQERTAVAWGDPHIKVFDHPYVSKDNRLKTASQNWQNSNLNLMEPGTYWFVKTPNNLISIQGVYGWGWRAVVRNVAVSGLFIKNDVIQLFPIHKAGGPSTDTGLYYQYNGESRSQLHKWVEKGWEWQNKRKDVSIKWAHNTDGLYKNNRWRCKIELPLFVELIINIYKHHMDVVVTMRPIESMYGDFGNMNGDEKDEMKWNPHLHDRNKYWYQTTTAHGTRVAEADNLFPFWYDVPAPPSGATTALLESNSSATDSTAEEGQQQDQQDQQVDSSDSDEFDDFDGPNTTVVDGVKLRPRRGPGGQGSGHDCTRKERVAARKLCHDMFKVNNSVRECILDVCQQGPKMAQKANIVEDEVEELEEEETIEHFKIYSGGQLYKSCFNAAEHFTKVAAMPRDERELGLIKEQAVEPTLLGAKCAGEKWVYVDGTSVPDAVISSSCTDGQLLCVEGQAVSACEGAEKIACQVPRLYSCRAHVAADLLESACPGGMQVAVPKSVRENQEAQKAMDSELCTTKQAWSGYSEKCFEENQVELQPCDTEEKTVMCETKFG